ncbi:uncharacterized protein LOC109611337 [Ooceraea biroi]|uniref:uncharacterized protein LOC109611337 n=1 Tax=Ooceraea biroi TaxID=2015173 RepID=UPI000F08BC75|nr:uncharacterized protein LOC109611337 [Ooceraea biroi]
MADVLKAWLRTRLGVLMDLTPDMFGRYTRDGTLLAQILHSYGIISSSQLSTIIRTQDPAVSRVNLRTLRIWLKLINVTLNDDCINDISKGKGAAALQLFYKVYLSLEGKDRLHFIALQKEREKFTPTSSRFEVCKVSEDPPPYHPPEHPLSKPLIKAADTVFWHRNKFWTITEACRRERRRFEAIMEYPVVEPVEYFIPEEMPKRKEESERLDEFARRYPARKMKKGYQVVECCPGKKSLAISCIKDSAAAAQYVDSLKKRSEKAAKSHELKLKSQAAMMTDAWEQLLRKQDRSFDEALGRRVLDQSRYEKRMMRKLCEVWDLRNRIVENRRIVDAMLLRTMESEHRFSEDRCREITKGETEDVEVEACRMRELRRKIRDEKVRRMREKHQAICAEILRDLTDIAVKIAQYRQTNNSHISYSIWSECRTLFLKSQSIFEDFDEIVEIEDKGETENAEEIRNKIQITISRNKVKNGKDLTIEEEFQEKQRLHRVKVEHRRALANTDFENYQDLAAPWDKFVPEREQEAEEAFRLGCIVLGYIVHRLLEILYPSPVEVVPRPVPRVKVAAIILGITNFTLHEQLRELLKDSGIRLLRMEDAINHCLERYKQEMSHVKYIDLNIVSVTAKDVKRLETKSKIDDPRERHLKRMEKTKVMTPRSDAVAEEKQTQTPRQIPYDDTDSILSDTAYLVEEWRYAVSFEIDRVRQRLDVLNAAARSDITFLLDTMGQVYHRIHHYIVERYKREIESISEMANVFCFAIEEEKAIQQELLLDGDRFVVRPNVLMFPEDPERSSVSIKEALSPLRFRMVQLGRLIDIFRRIAPRGNISERALVYVLQDLVSCDEKDCYPSSVPCAWRQLRPPDIERLIKGLFGAAERIEWREFVLYAMDLPMPTHQDILRARTAFGMQDLDSRKVVGRNEFHSTPLWFLETTLLAERNSHKDPRKDVETLPVEGFDRSNYDEVMDIMLREESRLGDRTVTDSRSKRDFIETDEGDSSSDNAILRSMLAKELLCRMYQVNRNMVHYPAMLLAFCKDEDPREGLGKAFTLAMGVRVCTNTVEGERYVEQLVKEKERIRKLKLSRDYLRQEANEITQDIVSYIMNRVDKSISMLEKMRSSDLAPKRRVMVQQLNGLDEIDPADLLPAEVIAEHLVIEDTSIFNAEQEYEATLVSISPATLEDHKENQRDERVIFWLPRNICIAVLSACLPRLALQADLFQTSLSLHEGIMRAYDELTDNELNDERDVVLAHRLVNHDFIRELLSASSNFVSKNMSDLLRSILMNRDNVTVDC